VRVVFEGLKVIHLHAYLQSIREDENYRRRIEEHGVFVIHFPNHMHRFRDDPQRAGFMLEPVDRTRRYIHALDSTWPLKYDIPCRQEIRPEVVDPQKIHKLEERSAK